MIFKGFSWRCWSWEIHDGSYVQTFCKAPEMNGQKAMTLFRTHSSAQAGNFHVGMVHCQLRYRCWVSSTLTCEGMGSPRSVAGTHVPPPTKLPFVNVLGWGEPKHLHFNMSVAVLHSTIFENHLSIKDYLHSELWLISISGLERVCAAENLSDTQLTSHIHKFHIFWFKQPWIIMIWKIFSVLNTYDLFCCGCSCSLNLP